MRLSIISSVIIAFASINSNGEVNVTASRKYVDQKVTSVSNSIISEVSYKLSEELKLKADKSGTLSGYGITNAVELVKDSKNNNTAVTIGSRKLSVGTSSLANGLDVTASGNYSHAEGDGTTASEFGSHSEGYLTTASGRYSHAAGRETTATGAFSYAEGYLTTAAGAYSHASGYKSHTRTNDNYAFSWNGDKKISEPYSSKGPGTFNINPVGGAGGFYIGEHTLSGLISDEIHNKVSYDPTAAEPLGTAEKILECSTKALTETNLNDLAENKPMQQSIVGRLTDEGITISVSEGRLILEDSNKILWECSPDEIISCYTNRMYRLSTCGFCSNTITFTNLTGVAELIIQAPKEVDGKANDFVVYASVPENEECVLSLEGFVRVFAKDSTAMNDLSPGLTVLYFTQFMAGGYYTMSRQMFKADVTQ